VFVFVLGIEAADAKIEVTERLLNSEKQSVGEVPKWLEESEGGDHGRGKRRTPLHSSNMDVEG
jgi:hypothetical protein